MPPTLAQTAYQGFTVVGWNPTYAPNPSCCSDMRNLCANCARTALAVAPFLANNCRCDQQSDRGDYLPIPTYNWSNSGLEPVMPGDDADLLLPPTVNWGEQPKRGRTQEPEPDYLPIPGMGGY